jgi:LAGLIDADG-like domain
LAVELNTHELAWAAGLFDGEGWIGFEKKSGVSMEINQVGREVLDRFRSAVLGLGKVTGPYEKRRRGPGWHPQFRWSAHSYQATQAIVALLWKFLSPIKRNQCGAAMRAMMERPRMPGTKYNHLHMCRRGLHSMEAGDPNVYIRPGTQERQCRQCVKDNNRSKRAAKTADG